MTDCTVITPEL